ncbi:MAG: hypothetical protein ETSY1_19275 [Candidatus Entotheonella factor]|uniref:4-vinyl reductase 4VR domain-containing protein n=1 Tax=Entotheonella factor TaxID=1429438 RepID=W4LKV2_ENTF1|nr:phosphatase RsbU N-terminal domain-containing protein [Candidatus Entotheonella palauensis]ETW98315.1 MAG: hypothetical protein ETSY1_19275 [Candidatus Entotheonella factor]
MDQSYEDKYFALLHTYVNDPNEEALASTAALGRELLLANIPLEDVVELHEKALSHMAQQSPALTLLDASRRVSAPLMELFMAYSLSWREQIHERLVARGLVGEMLRDLMALGGSSETTMHHAGQRLAANSQAKTLTQALSTFTSMGLGGLTLIETDEDPRRWTFAGHDLMEVNKEDGQPTCHYTRGFLHGAVRQVARDVRVADAEVACQSMGDPTCRFVVQVIGE